MVMMQHLVGSTLPNAELPATDGTTVNPAHLKGRAAIFCFPYTGRPGVADPPDWDNIPGAHGSTAQAQAYSRLYGSFTTQNVKLFGLSFQDTAWQMEFVRRQHLRFSLLSDAGRDFATALALPVFTAGQHTYLKRLTLIVSDGVIVALRFPVPVPENDAAETLALLQAR